MRHITFGDLKTEVMAAMEVTKPKQWRKGQFVFNYVDEVYGIARHVQFVDHVDCFYNDDQIDSFLRCVVDRYNYLIDCQEKN